MAESNGDIQPTITIKWDEDRQDVSMTTSGFKSLNFIVVCLEAAKIHAEHQLKAALMNQMQQQAIEAAKANAIAGKLLRG